MFNGIMSALLESGKEADASNILRDETRRLSKQIVAITPPTKSVHGNPKTSGEMAIHGELASLFSEASESLIDEIGSLHGVRNVDTFITRPQGDKLNLKWENIDPLGARMSEYHHKFQNRRGKIPPMKSGGRGVWKARVVIPSGMLKPYEKKLKKRVGRWKASWALIGSQLGAKFPAWITRHFGSIQDIATSQPEGLNNKHWLSVTFGSSAPGNSRQAGIIQAAVNQRAKSIKRRIRLVLSGYAKDVAAGMKARPHANETAEPEMVVVE